VRKIWDRRGFEECEPIEGLYTLLSYPIIFVARCIRLYHAVVYCTMLWRIILFCPIMYYHELDTYHNKS
jgi:hypothetical protein